MADAFGSGVQIPNVAPGVNARPADAGFVRLYAKNDVIYVVLPTGDEFPLSVEGLPLFIQDDQPVTSGKYMWIQTNYLEPGGVTVWFEDGV